MRVGRICRVLSAGVAALLFAACEQKLPADGENGAKSKSKENVGDSQVLTPPLTIATEGRAPLKRDSAHLPRTFAAWRDQVRSVQPTVAGVTLGRVDYADPWILIGDSVAIGFDRGTSAVVITDMRTGARSRVGRVGQGPLEFSPHASLARWVGDSVLVIDRPQLRATVLDIRTRNGRSFGFAEGDTSKVGEPIAFLKGTGIAHQSRELNGASGVTGMYRATRILRVVSASTQEVKMAAHLQGEMGIRVAVGEARIIGSAPVVLAPLLTAAPEDLWWVPGGTDSLYQLGRSSPRFVGRLEVPIARLSAAEKTRLKDAYLSKFSKSQEVFGAVARIVSIPDSISSLGSLSSSDDGSLWFRISAVGTEDVGSVWIQAQPNASIVRCFFIPPEQRILAFGQTIAIIATRDSTDDTYDLGVARLSMGCPASSLRLWN